MYDLTFFRSHIEEIRERLARRGYVLDVDTFREVDGDRRRNIAEGEQLKAERNQATAEIAKLRKAGADTTEQQKAVREMGEHVAALDRLVAEKDLVFQDFLSSIPNLPHESVPEGKGENDNREVRKWGSLPEFSFTQIGRAHV